MLRGEDPLMALAAFSFEHSREHFGGPRSAVPWHGTFVLIRDECDRARAPVRDQFFDGGFFAQWSLVEG